MPSPKGRSWLKWAIWSPIALVLIGVAGLLVADHLVESEIVAEEEKLLAMGIDVRPSPPSEDAKEDYLAISKIISQADPRLEPSEHLLSLLEKAATKTQTSFEWPSYLSRGPDKYAASIDPIAEYCARLANRAGERRDREMLDRLFDFEIKLSRQILIGSGRDLASAYSVWSPPLSTLRFLNPEVSAWRRHKLENADLRAMTRSYLSGLGRNMCRFNVGSAPNSLGVAIPKSWWKRAIEAQTSFRKRAELAALRNLRLLAQRVLKMETRRAFGQDVQQELPLELAKDKS